MYISIYKIFQQKKNVTHKSKINFHSSQAFFFIYITRELNKMDSIALGIFLF